MDDWEDEFVLIESQDEHPEQETRNEHLDAPQRSKALNTGAPAATDAGLPRITSPQAVYQCEHPEIRTESGLAHRSSQIQAFCGWMTHILKKQDPNISPVADLFDVLSHAAHLDAIISYVTGTKVEALQEAHSSYEKLTNLNIASNHFLQTFPDATPASSSAILARNPKATLDFVWTLFYHSQLKRAQYCGLHDRFAILLWCQHTVATSPMVVTISDFLQSFSDGIALCAIVESFHPNALDLQDLSPIHKTDNLRKAFDAIEKHFGIPKLLSPLDVISETPDEISIIVYLTLIFKHCTEK